MQLKEEESGYLTVQTPGLTQEQQDYIAQYVRIYLSEAYTMDPRPFVYDSITGGYEAHYRQNEWPISQLGQSGVNANGVTYSNRMRTVCSVFTGSMLHQALGVDIWDAGINGAGYSNPNPDKRGAQYFNKVQDNEPLQPGDIIAWGNYGHSMIYIGCDPETGKHQIAQTDGTRNVIGISSIKNVPASYDGKAITPAQIRAWGGTKMTEYGETAPYGHVARLKPEIIDPNWTTPQVTKIQWPNGTITEWSGEIVSTKVDMNAPLFYAGIADKVGILGGTNPIKNVIETFGEIINYLIGWITMVIRIPFVGIASVAERLVTAVVEVTSTESMDSTLTLEKIVYNQVPIFDVNLFDMEEAGGQPLSDETQSESVILSLRKNVAGWYVAFRNFVIVVLLIVLIYLGIRMAITSIAEEKAEYKRMLVDWFISFFMVFFIHYFLIVVLELNDLFIGIFSKQMQNANIGNLYESMSALAHSAKFTDGWYGAIMYIALVWFMVKYAWKYAKRLLSTFILVILSPLVAISYAIDKIKDNRSQSLSKWLKEIAFTVLIQSVHALIYTTFMIGIVSKITSNNNLLESIGVCVFLVIAVKFMDAAEDIFENIFGFKSSDSLKEIMNSSFEVIGTLRVVKNWAMSIYKFTWGTTKLAVKFSGFAINAGGKHIKPIGKLKQTYEDVKDGYKKEVEGKQIDDTPTVTGINKIIAKRKASAESKLAKESDTAKKAWGNSKNIIKNFGKAMPMLIENPMAGITYYIAGGVAVKEMLKFVKKNIGIFTKEQRTIKQAKKGIKGKFTGKKKAKQEEKMLCKVREKDITLRRIVDEVCGRRDSLINRGHRSNATSEERQQARALQEVVNFRLKEASKIIGFNAVAKAVIGEISDHTHSRNGQVLRGEGGTLTSQTAIDTIGKVIDQIQSTNPNFKGQFVSRFKEELQRTMQKRAGTSKVALTSQTAIDTIEKVIDQIQSTNPNFKVDKGQFVSHFKEELQRTMQRGAGTSKVVFTSQTAIDTIGKVIDQIQSTNPNFKGQFVSRFKEELQRTMQTGAGTSKVAFTSQTAIDTIEKVVKQIQSENSDFKVDNEQLVSHFKEELQRTMQTGASTSREALTSQTAQNETYTTQITMDTIGKIADRIQSESPDIRVDNERFIQNFKEEVLKAMLNRATGEIESIQIELDVDVDKTGETLSSRIEESKREALTYSSHMYLGREKAEEEVTRATRQPVADFLESEGNLNAIIEQLDVQDISHLVTRAINREGSIERRYNTRNRIQMTKKMEEELARYDAIIEQSVALRESYIESMDRIGETTAIPDLVKDIRSAVNKKRNAES